MTTRIKRVTLAPVAADAAGIAALQAPAAGAAFTLTAGAASLDPPRRLQMTATVTDVGDTVTVVGTDRSGTSRSEVITLVNGTALSKYEYTKITSITYGSGGAAGNVSAGWGAVFYTPWIPVDRYDSQGWAVAVDMAGLVNCTWSIQHTFKEDLLRTPYDFSVDETGVFDHGTLNGQTTSQNGSYAYPARAFRLKLTVTGALSGGPLQFIVTPQKGG